MSTNQTPPTADAAELRRAPITVLRWFAERPGTVDLIVVLACMGLQLVALTLAEPRTYWPGLVVVVCSSVPLLWRRRYPLIVLCVIVMISVVGLLIHPALGLQSIPFAFALYALAQTQSFARAAIGYGIGVTVPALGALVLFLVTGESFSPLILDPFALLALSLGLGVRNRRQRQEALAELLNQQLENARVVERNRITAEMHDVVAHSISIMIALANGASTGWKKHPERAATALENLGTVGRTALVDMRRVLHLLRDNDTDLAEALHRSGHNLPQLDELIEVFRSTGLPIHFIRSGRTLPEDPTLATTVYRIVQEALTNALRYATEATRVDVDIEVEETLLRITIIDNGTLPAGTPSHGSGRGLPGIAERAASYHGTSTAGPLPTGGWRTTATLQLNDNEREGHER